MSDIKRREFMILLGGASAGPGVGVGDHIVITNTGGTVTA